MYAKKIDANQHEIVDALRSSGCSVLILSMVGKGCPDILCGIDGINLLIEIKDGKKPPSQRKLTLPEEDFIRAWKGQVAIINTIEEAISLINKIKINSM